MYFNNTLITEQSIMLARRHFADIYQRIIDGVKDGTQLPASHVDLDKYVAQYEERKRAMLAGEMQNNFTFMQMAYYKQTGDCVALLP